MTPDRMLAPRARLGPPQEAIGARFDPSRCRKSKSHRDASGAVGSLTPAYDLHPLLKLPAELLKLLLETSHLIAQILHLRLKHLQP